MNQIGNRIKAERAAWSLLDDFAVDRPDELVLEDLARALGIEVRVRPLDKLEASIVRNGDDGVITLSDKGIDTRRQRFSLAHELGHWCLHPHLNQKLCSQSDMDDYRQSAEEVEANIFAANLLVSKKWISREVSHADPSFSVVDALADTCGVTLTVASRQYVELCKHPVVLVCSYNGRIAWSTCSDTAKSCWVPWGEDIHEYTATQECISEKSTFHSADDVEAEYWFPDVKEVEGLTVVEEVKNPRNFGFTLSMIWIPDLALWR